MKRYLALLLAVLMLTLCGCTVDPGSYVPTGDGLTWDADYTGPVYTHPNQMGEQQLTLIYYPNESLNPLLTSDFTNRALFTLMYQSLFCVDRDYNVHPILCKQYSVSQDMKTYTFYLENATFSDGSAVTAQDVVETLNAARSGGYYAGRLNHVSGISAGADGSVVIQTATPMENLPILLDIPVLKAGQLQENAPLGSGPYLLDNSTGSPVLRRRSDWWCKAELAARAPAITLVTAQDAPQIRDTFEFAELDLVCADPGSDRYADYRCDYELWDCENGIFLYLFCNMQSKVFSVPEVRSALTYAIDRDTIAAAYFRGFARAASLPASPLSPYYSQVQAQKYAYDGTGETLKNAVSGAGLVGNPVVLLVNSDDSLRVRVARDVGKALSDAGLAVELLEVGGSTYRKHLKDRTFDICMGQTKLSPNMDLSPFFDRKGALNYGGISDVGLYSLCTESLANHGNYYTLHQNVMDDGRICPVLFGSYAIYATRGLLTELSPSRDNVFFYTLGKTMEQTLIKTES